MLLLTKIGIGCEMIELQVLMLGSQRKAQVYVIVNRPMNLLESAIFRFKTNGRGLYWGAVPPYESTVMNHVVKLRHQINFWDAIKRSNGNKSSLTLFMK